MFSGGGQTSLSSLTELWSKLINYKVACHPELDSGSQSKEILNSDCIFKSQKLMFQNDMKRTKSAFTLAEVLITLSIIGIVAALTLPVLNDAINKKVRAEQIRTVKYKFTKATDKMNSLGLIGPYENTDAFVAQLQKHLKIAKICTANKLRACWPYDNVILQDGKEWDISKTQTGKQLMMNSDEYNDYTSPNVGIITADGTPMILNYNKKCAALDPVKLYSWTTEDNKPVSNATAGCVAAVFEINGSRKPNSLSKDVILFNANGLGTSCAIELDSGKCFTAPFSPVPVTIAECEEMKAKGMLDNCYYNNDYFGGAVKQCGGKANLPTQADLTKIANAIYKGNPVISPSATTDFLTYVSGTASDLGLPEPTFYMWAGEEYRDVYAYSRHFGPQYTSPRYTYRNTTNYQAVCLVD